MLHRVGLAVGEGEQAGRQRDAHTDSLQEAGDGDDQHDGEHDAVLGRREAPAEGHEPFVEEGHPEADDEPAEQKPGDVLDETTAGEGDHEAHGRRHIGHDPVRVPECPAQHGERHVVISRGSADEAGQDIGQAGGAQLTVEVEVLLIHDLDRVGIEQQPDDGENDDGQQIADLSENGPVVGVGEGRRANGDPPRALGERAEQPAARPGFIDRPERRGWMPRTAQGRPERRPGAPMVDESCVEQ